VLADPSLAPQPMQPGPSMTYPVICALCGATLFGAFGIGTVFPQLFSAAAGQDLTWAQAAVAGISGLLGGAIGWAMGYVLGD
jgi:hypothetical protein